MALAVLVLAFPAAAAAQVDAQDLPPGVALAPEEEQTADVLNPDPGEYVEATVIPADCETPDDHEECGYTVRSEGTYEEWVPETEE